MIKITELVPAQEVQVYMMLGLAIYPKKTKTGSRYAVPTKPQVTGNGHLTRFIGWVVANDPENEVLVVHVSKSNSHRQAIRPLMPMQVDLPYGAIQDLYVYSDVNFEPAEEVPGALSGKGYKWPGQISENVTTPRPYRTLTKVRI